MIDTRGRAEVIPLYLSRALGDIFPIQRNSRHRNSTAHDHVTVLPYPLASIFREGPPTESVDRFAF